MSKEHLFLIVMLSVISAACLASYAACGYMVKYVQLMPGQLKELKQTKAALAVLAVSGLVLTSIGIFR